MTAIARIAATAAAALCFLFAPTTALAEAPPAGAPASVTVRVLGPPPSYEALLSPKQITTTTTPVTKDEGSCSGTSAAGALELATAGNWEGNWSTKYNDYEVVSIEGHSYPFEEGAPANHYWSFWQDNVFAQVGICEAELQSGDQVLFVPSCYGSSCPPEPTQLLGLEVPTTGEVGKPVTVTARSYPTTGGSPAPAAGVTVTGGGAGGQTDSEGHVALTFTQNGTFTLRATGNGAEPRPIPGEANICVHNGNDGTCGTTIPSKTGPAKSLPLITPPAPEVVQAGGVKNGHIYTHRNAPRVLIGSVTVPVGSTLREIRLSLERAHRGHCFAFNGRLAAFVRSHCHTPHFFKVAQTTSFSYLLPSRLRPGRYVYLVEAVGSTSNAASSNVRTRIAFDVK